ncbi:hypothetical protein RFI_14924 [Reticulomyxa filosa]|uniref:Uncharacterized protein n=1 Tax=Reticulomyxa filosa TaxID=46433 RepID=X6N8P4_RETFI|nr:hypothetical protein RFI_14924 [Reticulomyxa filosa]|eukprot:ETO22278.1 hypothetical protein RFI_14924 [Reticulomyxa filosa]
MKAPKYKKWRIDISTYQKKIVNTNEESDLEKIKMVILICTKQLFFEIDILVSDAFVTLKKIFFQRSKMFTTNTLNNSHIFSSGYNDNQFKSEPNVNKVSLGGCAPTSEHVEASYYDPSKTMMNSALSGSEQYPVRLTYDWHLFYLLLYRLWKEERKTSKKKKSKKKKRIKISTFILLFFFFLMWYASD